MKDFFKKWFGTASRYLDSGNMSSLGDEQRYRLRLQNGLLLAGSIVLALFTVIDLIRDAYVELFLDVSYIVILQIPVYLNRLRLYRSSRDLSVVLLTSAIVANALVLGVASGAPWLLVIVSSYVWSIYPHEELKKIFFLVVTNFIIAVILLTYPLTDFVQPTSSDLPTLRFLQASLMFASISIIGFYSSRQARRYLLQIFLAHKREQESITQMQAASKMSSLGEMAAGIAHEINNPLAIIRGKVEMMLKSMERDDFDRASLQKNLQDIVETTNRMKRITTGMLAFARKGGNIGRGPYDLRGLIEQSIEFLKQLKAYEEITISLNWPEKAPRVVCDPGFVQQILVNLISNAGDAIRGANLAEKGHIQIDFKRIDQAFFAVEVTDNGSGIPDDIAMRIMDPFFTTKPVGAGTGLGLSLSKGLAQSMGGDLVVASLRNPTKFVLTLPVAGSRNRAA